LRVAGVEDAPTAVGDAKDVIMTRVYVEPLGSQCAGADVEHDREALSGDHVEDLLHKDQTLARGEVRNAATCDGEPFAGGGGAVLRLRLDEGELLAPQVLLTISHFDLITTAHGGGRSDRIGARALGDVGLHPGDHARSIRGRRYAGEGDANVPLPKSASRPGRNPMDDCTHCSPPKTLS